MLTIALAQMRCEVGNLVGNADRMRDFAHRAVAQHGADLVAFPELALTGYPPEDLLLRRDFVSAARSALEDFMRRAPAVDMLVGLPWAEAGLVYNACVWIHHQDIAGVYRKQILPNYGVFDERRYFTPGSAPLVCTVAGVRVGVTVCEDLWEPGPTLAARAAGAEILININASPYHREKAALRLAVAGARVAEAGLPLLYVNTIGGQDELVFDGASFVLDRQGQPVMQAVAFQEDLAVACRETSGEWRPGVFHRWPVGPEALYEALVLGLRDYVKKNGFQRLVLGLSGGIDSALTLALCRDALPELPLSAVMMPSRYTHRMSSEDAREQAQALGADWEIIPIDTLYARLSEALAGHWDGPGQSVAAENLQARIRGTLLMTMANARAGLVVVTSNKSELAVGYTTLYGDMAGGYAPLKDVFKTDVYALARYRNSRGMVIPERVLERAPTAELRFDQKDTDSLPPYDVLDAVLTAFIEQNCGREELMAAGFAPDLVDRVLGLVRRAEHKRKQAPLGTRVSPRGFGRDWRYPVTAAVYDPPTR